MAQGDGNGWGELIGGGLFLFAAWGAFAYLLPDWRIKYAVRYFTPYEHVTVEARPTKCDFFRTPIGSKGCHYEKIISTAEWRRSEKTGDAILSNDEGKTWEVRDPPPDTKIPTKFVWVDWNRIEDP